VILNIEENPFVEGCPPPQCFDSLHAAALFDNDHQAGDADLAERAIDCTQGVGKALERQDQNVDAYRSRCSERFSAVDVNFHQENLAERTTPPNYPYHAEITSEGASGQPVAQPTYSPVQIIYSMPSTAVGSERERAS
jgi:hypothetical protein